MEVSKKTAQAIVYAIKYHLEINGLTEIQEARWLAIGLAADIKRIMQREANPPLYCGGCGYCLDCLRLERENA